MKLLYFIEALFGPALLEEQGEIGRRQSEALATLRKSCAGRFWGLQAGSISDKVVRDPPKEMFENITSAELEKQYKDLRAWLHATSSEFYGCEFFRAEQYAVRKLSADGSPLGNSFMITPEMLVETSQWGRIIAKVGASVTAKKHGRCEVVHVWRKPDAEKLYSFVMSTPYCEIATRKIWHITMAYHYAVQVSLESQTLAEHVNSVLAHVQSRTGHQLGTKQLVYATKLRATGLRGLGGEDNFITMALNYHFGGDSPTKWHFTRDQKRKRSLVDKVAERERIKREVRQQTVDASIRTTN